MESDSLLIIYGLASFGGLSSFVAHEKGRSAFLWLLLGLAFNIVALLIIAFLPAKKTLESETEPKLTLPAPKTNWSCPKCKAVNDPNTTVCLNCHFRLLPIKKFTDDIWECPQCKRLNHPDELSCLNCSYPNIA